jgi:hypothetical protein
VYGPVPPDGVKVAEPLQTLLQVRLAEELREDDKEELKMVTVSETLTQEPAVVIFTV